MSKKDWDKTFKKLPCPICGDTHGCLYAKDRSAILCIHPHKIAKQGPKHIQFCDRHFVKELPGGLYLYRMTSEWKDYHTGGLEEDIESGHLVIPKIIPELEVIRASKIEAKPVRWFWRDRIPAGMITLLFGNSEAGKSILMSDMATRTSTGNRWPDGAPCQKGSVLIFSAEEDKERVLVPRLKAMGADMKRIIFGKGIIEEDSEKRWFDVKKNLPSLKQYLKENRQIRFTIIDPITAYLSRRGRDENLEIRNALSPLEELAEKYKNTMVLVTHMNKRIDTSAPALHRAIGSIAYGAVVRSAWVVLKDRDDEERRLFLKAKLSLGPAQLGLAFRIEQTGKWRTQVIVDWENGFVAETADEILSRSIGRRPVKADRAKDAIIKALKNGPLKVSKLKQISKNEKISWRTFVDAKDELKITSFRRYNAMTGEFYWMWKL